MAYISNLILSKDDGLANARKELMETIESYDSILEGLIDGNKELGTRNYMIIKFVKKFNCLRKSG